ncbi:MAG: DUF1223 domain-containing protein [Bacteroidia bacterium]|nr:DUF1223 domain-containing protein [Bacteroidia bacterium]
MIKSAILTLFILLFSINLQAQQKQKFVPSVLVEFYTSEGCGSCLQADEFSAQIRAIADSSKMRVFTLDYHVDLWNLSGWVDPFSDTIYTIRQQTMAVANNQRAMFTPMVFVNGTGALPSGAKSEVGKLIEKFTRNPAENFLLMSASWNPNTKILDFEYEAKGETDSLDIYFVLTQKNASSVPNGGENKDKKLHHKNVAIKMVNSTNVKATGSIGMVMPVPNVDFDKYIVYGFLQHKRTKQITATQVLEFNQMQPTE